MEKDTDNQPSSPPLKVLALSHLSEFSEAFHYIEFENRDGVLSRHLLPSKYINQKANLGTWLTDRGFIFPRNTKDSDRIVNLLHSASAEVAERVTLSHKPGFLEEAYLYPNNLVFNSNEAHGPLLVPGANMHLPNVQSSGDLEIWKTNVAPYALHSTRCMLVLCSGFSAPLLRFIDMECGGFHFFGKSSTGKTSALRFAASAYGDPSVLMSWGVTDKAMEEVAEGHNDFPLILDEMALLDSVPERASTRAQNISYKLAQGTGTRRSKGYEKRPTSWKLVFLSSGENSLNKHAAAGGIARMLGECVRVVDVPADAGTGRGIFETFPDESASAEDNIKQIQDAYKANYGTAMPKFIDKLTTGKLMREGKVGERVDKLIEKFIKQNCSDELDGHEIRMAKRFGLAYAGGIFALKYDILPFTENQVMEGISACYRDAMTEFSSTLEATKPVTEKAREAWEQIKGDLRQGRKGPILCCKRTVDGQRVISLRGSTFEKLVPDRKVRECLVVLLRTGGLLLLDAEGKSTRSLPVWKDGSKVRRRRYCFIMDKLDSMAA